MISLVCSDRLLLFTDVQALSHHGEPGGYFDKSNPLLGLIPVVISAATMTLLSTVYSSVALTLTAMENHKHISEYDASLIYKRFFFNVFVYWLQLFYVAFWELDIVKLRTLCDLLFIHYLLIFLCIL